MNIFLHGWIITIAALVVAFSRQSAWAETTNLSLSIEPASLAFIEGEPVQIVMNFKNNGNSSERVNLGADGTGNIKAIVEDEKGNKNYGKENAKGGLHFLFNLNVEPKSVKSYCIILDDLTVIRKIGRYQLTIEIKSTSLVSNKTEFHILPLDSKNDDILKAKYKQLWKTADMKSPSEAQRYALKIICLTRNKVAIEYQKQIVLENKVSYELFDAAVDALISTRDPETLKFLVDNFLARKDADRNRQNQVLYRLRLAGVDKWDEQRYKELIPYKEMIKSAAPIGVSD